MKTKLLKLALIVSGIVLFHNLSAQSSNLPLNEDVYHQIRRQEVLNGRLARNFDLSVMPFQRHKIAEFINASDTLSEENSGFEYFYDELWDFFPDTGNSEKPVLKYFWRKKRDFVHYQDSSFTFHLNPIIYTSIGSEQNRDDALYINTRGVELSGRLSEKIAFYSMVAENQVRLPSFVDAYVRKFGAIPNEGFWKPFKEGQGGYDFFTARGHISFDPIEIMNLQFGHGPQFVGSGYRSMILSDFANNYLFLRLNTSVWKIQYTNLFAQLTSDVTSFGNNPPIPAGNQRFPKKYLAFHRFGIDIGNNLNLGFFESIVFGGADSLGNSTLDINYLNPVIFYRAIEQQVGSEDNAILGMDFKWNFLRHFSLYGQLVLDEFLLDRIRERNGWWANKQSGQIGLYYIDALGIDNLDLQGEVNIARPYTYTHGDNRTRPEIAAASYSSFNQPLAHPLGANFYEFLGVLRYRPFPKLYINGIISYAITGTDTAGSNWGSNIILDNRTREQEFNNEIAQGVSRDIFFFQGRISYMIRHDMFADLETGYRIESLGNRVENLKSVYLNLALRWNIAARNYLF